MTTLEKIFIKAIEKVEQEPCTDAVSRKDVINAIDKWITEYKPQHYLIQSIRELPSVNPQKSVIEDIKAEIERLHYHPKLDFIKNDEVVDMALDIIDKYMKEQTE